MRAETIDKPDLLLYLRAVELQEFYRDYPTAIIEWCDCYSGFDLYG